MKETIQNLLESHKAFNMIRSLVVTVTIKRIHKLGCLMCNSVCLHRSVT